MTRNSPAKHSSKQTLKQATPAPHDDFDDYRLWAREAIPSAERPSLSEIRKDWEGQPADHAADFAKSVRCFWDAKRDHAAAKVNLRKVASVITDMKEARDHGHIMETYLQDAKDNQKALNGAIVGYQAAISATITQLDALDMLAARLEGELQWYFQEHQMELRIPLSEERELCDDCILTIKDFDDELTEYTVKLLEDFAAVIFKNVPEPKSSSIPARDDGRSSSKRKRQDEAGGANSKATRLSKDANVEPVKSAQPGAEPSLRQEQHSGLDTGDASPNQAPRNGSTEQAVITHEDLPLPSTGVAGPATAWLIENPAQFTPSFISWCRRQILDRGYRTLNEVEPLAEAFLNFRKVTWDEHDWENEGDVPYLPFPPDGFQVLFPDGREWPNVRRLKAMTQGASEDLRHYVRRQLYTNGAIFTHANLFAGQVIELMQRRGPQHDWDMEDDLDVWKAPLAETSTIPLERLPGRWNVSVIL